MNYSHYQSSIHNFGVMNAPRGPARDQDLGHGVRSLCLEEFRNNIKSNSRRYELKEIYNYVVEFSGDQHGSRFIQQKLETANSDEKDQIFREIQPNALQLMTDVFGNYVIQKLFEHGNQIQKKIWSFSSLLAVSSFCRYCWFSSSRRARSSARRTECSSTARSSSGLIR